MAFSKQVQRLIQTSGQSCYQIAAETGIDKATLSRFLNGKGGLSLAALDALAAHLGWTVVSEQAQSRKGK